MIIKRRTQIYFHEECYLKTLVQVMRSVGIMDQIWDDCTVLVDNIMKWFTASDWMSLTKREKAKWCEEFGLDHIYTELKESE